MKTTIKILAYVALCVIAMLGICGLFGEPTSEYWDWMHRNFGVFGFLWFFLEKAFWACLLAGVYHCWVELDLRIEEEGI